MMQCTERCHNQLSAKLLVQPSTSEDQQFTLHAFGTPLHELAQVPTVEQVTREALLNGPPLNSIAYNENGVHEIDRIWGQFHHSIHDSYHLVHQMYEHSCNVSFNME